MKYLLLFIFFGSGLTAISQPMFENISFSDAILKSRKTGKLILVQFESIDCERCNYVASDGMDDLDLSKRIRETFIAIKVDSKHQDRGMITGLYDLNIQSFGTMFIDGSKNLIHRFDQTTTLTSKYNEQFDLALYNYSETMKLDVFEQAYQKFGTNDKLEEWIWARTALNLKSDSLLHIYARNLSKDTRNSTMAFTFIAKQAPLVASLPDQILRSHSQFDSLWYTLPSADRVKINHRIISKSMQKAIDEKDQEYALKVANFAWAIYGKDRVGAANNYYFQWVKFFEGTKNMPQYMIFAAYYYDSITSKNSVAQVLRNDSIQKIESFKNAKMQSTPTSKTETKMVKSSKFTSTTQYYTNFLNHAAWFVYSNSDNKQYLKKALEWASLANQYFQNFEAIDTEARILYKLGDKEAAVRLMETAVRLKNETIRQKNAFSSLDVVLRNMKENRIVIDIQ